MLCILIIIFLTDGAFTESISPGHCPNITLDRQLDLSKYQGQWYEYKRSSIIWSNADKCTSLKWRRIGNQWTITSSGISSLANSGSKSTTFSKTSLIGNSKIGVTNYSAVLGVSYREYYILETDNENYSIIWSCENKGKGHIRNAWILTRKINPTVNIEKIAKRVFGTHCIEMPPMSRVDHYNC
ncbi:apolipoprotein D-like [Microplitis mediator]|uniref:apolipoprotein D-like n=1 Tax=Microplitis mediator TaxID=375433 RepID=UPI002556FCC9|nr:apolipoprotein D-like [Microplitis mediator]